MFRSLFLFTTGDSFLRNVFKAFSTKRRIFPLKSFVPTMVPLTAAKKLLRSFGDSVVWLDKPADCKEQCAGPTRNRAIAIARHSYLAFIDSDDIFLSGHLFRLFHFLETHSDFVGAIDQLMGFMDGSKNLWLWKYEDANIVQLESFFLNLYFGLQVLMIRRSVIVQTDNRFDPALRSAQDIDFFLRILEKKSITILS